MSQHKNLEDFEEVIRQCVKCGACQAHCPTYLVTKKEGAVARGKIALAAALLDGDTKLAGALENDIDMCLMCGSCTHKCPINVPTQEIVGAVRRRITDEKGLSFSGKSISTILGSKKIMNSLARTGSMLSPLVLKQIPQSSGLRLRIPTTFMENRTLPKPARKHLFERVPEYIKGKVEQPVIGFFAGCSITYLYPKIGEQMISILKNLGCSVYTPSVQQCCGLPTLTSGNGEMVTKLATNNIKAFNDRKVDYIVTACASCNGTIGEYYASMKTDQTHFNEKVVDFSVLLQRIGLFERLEQIKKRKDRINVTYHDPCHLKLQNIIQEPRQLLQSLPQVDYIEMEGAAKCCGLGGTFSVFHYDTSRAIGTQKMEGLRDSGAQLIATGCPGCIMQLQDSINHAELPVQAVHLLDLLAEALEQKPPQDNKKAHQE